MSSRDVPARDRWRTATGVLAVVSLVTVLTVATVALVVVRRDAPAPAGGPAADPRVGWQTVRGEGAAYQVPPDWEVRPAAEQVSYRDDTGRPQARGAALSTYHGNRCPEGVDHPGAWAVLAEPVRARDPGSVAEAASRQWARGFGAGASGSAEVPAPRVEPVELATGARAVLATVSLDLRGLDNPCGQETAELAVVAAPDRELVRLLVVGRHPDVRDGVDETVARQILRSLT